MRMKTLVGLLAATTMSLPAHAALLTFDDLTVGLNLTEQVTNGYGGLDWDNFFALNPSSEAGSSFLNSGYLGGRVSTPNVAFNGGATPASLSATNAFLLTSGYFAAAWVDGLEISFTGSLGGSQVFARTVTVSRTASFIEFGHTIDLLEINSTCDLTTTCSLPTDVSSSGNNFVLDNLQIGEATNPVPEPGALALIAGGLLGLGLTRPARANRRTRV